MVKCGGSGTARSSRRSVVRIKRQPLPRSSCSTADHAAALGQRHMRPDMMDRDQPSASRRTRASTALHVVPPVMVTVDHAPCRRSHDEQSSHRLEVHETIRPHSIGRGAGRRPHDSLLHTARHRLCLSMRGATLVQAARRRPVALRRVLQHAAPPHHARFRHSPVHGVGCAFEYRGAMALLVVCRGHGRLQTVRRWPHPPVMLASHVLGGRPGPRRTFDTECQLTTDAANSIFASPKSVGIVGPLSIAWLAETIVEGFYVLGFTSTQVRTSPTAAGTAACLVGVNY